MSFQLLTPLEKLESKVVSIFHYLFQSPFKIGFSHLMKKSTPTTLLLIFFYILTTSNALASTPPLNQPLHDLAIQYDLYDLENPLDTKKALEAIRYQPSVHTNKVIDSSIKSLNNTTHQFMHQGQTFILIIIVSIVEIVRQEIIYSNLALNSLTREQIKEKIDEATEKILLGGDIWAAMFGATATSRLGAKPLALIQALIMDLNTRMVFKQILTNGAFTLVTFVGWEFGVSVFEKARGRLSPSEFEETEHFIALMWSVFMDGKHQTHEAQLVRKVFRKAFVIFFSDPDLRYNTFRHQIFTGEFINLVSALTLAATASASVGAAVGGAIGTAIAPIVGTAAGAGTGAVVGWLFGFVGVGAGLSLTLFIPDQYTDTISNSIANARRSFINFYHGDLPGSRNQIQHDINKAYNSIVNTNGVAFHPHFRFSENPHHYNLLIDIYLEKLFRVESRISGFLGKQTVATIAGNTTALPEINTNLAYYEDLKLQIFKDLLDFYPQRVRQLFSNTNYLNLMSLEEPSNQYAQSFISSVRSYGTNILHLTNFFVSLALSAATNDIENEDYLNYRYFINESLEKPFDASVLLKSVQN